LLNLRLPKNDETGEGVGWYGTKEITAMSEKEGSKPATEDKKHRTLEMYRSLLEVEIKNLLRRVGSITRTQDALLVNVNNFAINLEEVIGVMERLETSRDYFRQEIASLHKATKKNEEDSEALLKRLRSLHRRLDILEKKNRQ
jgi:chromosome segregation ATPase